MILRHIVLATLLVLAACTSAPAQESAWSARAVDELVAVANDAPAEGLPAPAPELDALQAAQASGGDIDAAADALFLRVAQDFAVGRAAGAEASWKIGRPAPNLQLLRDQALATGAVSASLRGLLPTNADYAALRDALAAARAEGGDKAHIPTLRANLERWRWAPRDLPATRVEIRVPFFTLYRYENGAVAAEHRVIVGAATTPTPSFATQIEAVTVNPYWTPPTSILLNELLPSFRRDPGRVTRQDYEVLDRDGTPLDPFAVNWSARPFPYRIRQRPGVQNALGRLKLEMPNPYAIYLHDTPSKTLFARSERAFSHGCMRVQDPLDLAAALGAGASEDLTALIETGESEQISLAAPIPVYVLYLTAMPDAEGAMRYARDVYRRDEALVRALDTGEALTEMRTAALGQCAAG